MDHTSLHIQEIQRSKYIQLDNDFMSPRKCKTVISDLKSSNYGKLGLSGHSYKQGTLKTEVPVNIKYVNKEDVNRKRQKELMYKQKFLAKMNFLNTQGEKTELLSKVEIWIEDNLE